MKKTKIRLILNYELSDCEKGELSLEERCYLFREGYTQKVNKEDYYVYATTSKVPSTIDFYDQMISLDLHHFIKDFYGLQKLRVERTNIFLSELASGKIKLHFGKDGFLYCDEKQTHIQLLSYRYYYSEQISFFKQNEEKIRYYEKWGYRPIYQADSNLVIMYKDPMLFFNFKVAGKQYEIYANQLMEDLGIGRWSDKKVKNFYYQLIQNSIKITLDKYGNVILST